MPEKNLKIAFESIRKYLKNSEILKNRNGLKNYDLAIIYFSHRKMFVPNQKINQTVISEYYDNVKSPVYYYGLPKPERPVYTKKPKPRIEVESGKPVKHLEKYRKYLKSKKWKSFSNRIKAQRKHTCEICGSNKKGIYLHAHHLTYVRIFKERPEDIQILCDKCHAKAHNLKDNHQQGPTL